MRRRVWVIGVAAALMLVMALIAYNARKNLPIQKVQEEIARLKREGEPTSWREVASPVPKHLDGTPLYRQAFKQLEAAQSKFAPNVWQTYNPQVLQAAKPALQTLRKALEFPHMRLIDLKEAEFQFYFTSSWFPQFAHFREFARLLRMEARQRRLIAIASKGIPYDRQALRRLEVEMEQKCQQGWAIRLGKVEIWWRPYDLISILAPHWHYLVEAGRLGAGVKMKSSSG